MTAYEIISIFLGVLSLLIAFGSLLIAIIAFLDREEQEEIKMPILSANRIGGGRKTI